MEPEQAVSAQLRALGIQPAEVKVVVMTHLHSDHASGIAEFPESTFVVSSRRVGGGRLGRAHARATGAASSTTPSTGARVDFESPDADSFATFGRAFDLFGDGSVRARLHARAHRRPPVGGAPPARPRGAAHRRRRVHAPHASRRSRAALPDGGRAPLPALAARDPALRARAPGRARDLRARLRAVASAARRCYE